MKATLKESKGSGRALKPPRTNEEGWREMGLKQSHHKFRGDLKRKKNLRMDLHKMGINHRQFCRNPEAFLTHFQQRLDVLQREVEKEAQEKWNVQRHYEELQVENKRSQEALKSDLQHQTDQNKVLREELETLKVDRQKYEREVANFRKKTKILQSEFEKEVQEMENLQKHYKDLQVEHKQSQNILTSHLQREKDKNNVLQEELETLKVSHQEDRKKYKGEVASLRKQSVNLQQKLQKEVQEKANLQNHYKDLQVEHKQGHNILKADLQREKDKNKVLQEDVETLKVSQQDYQRSEGDVGRPRRQNKNLRRGAEGEVREKRILQPHYVDLQVELEQSQNMLTSYLQHERNKQKVLQEELEKLKASHQEDRKKYEGDVDSLRRQTNNFQRQIEEEVREKANLQKRFEDLQNTLTLDLQREREKNKVLQKVLEQFKVSHQKVRQTFERNAASYRKQTKNLQRVVEGEVQKKWILQEHYENLQNTLKSDLQHERDKNYVLQENLGSLKVSHQRDECDLINLQRKTENLQNEGEKKVQPEGNIQKHEDLQVDIKQSQNKPTSAFMPDRDKNKVLQEELERLKVSLQGERHEARLRIQRENHQNEAEKEVHEKRILRQHYEVLQDTLTSDLQRERDKNNVLQEEVVRLKGSHQGNRQKDERDVAVLQKQTKNLQREVEKASQHKNILLNHYQELQKVLHRNQNVFTGMFRSQREQIMLLQEELDKTKGSLGSVCQTSGVHLSQQGDNLLLEEQEPTYQSTSKKWHLLHRPTAEKENLSQTRAEMIGQNPEGRRGLQAQRDDNPPPHKKPRRGHV